MGRREFLKTAAAARWGNLLSSEEGQGKRRGKMCSVLAQAFALLLVLCCPQWRSLDTQFGLEYTYVTRGF